MANPERMEGGLTERCHAWPETASPTRQCTGGRLVMTHYHGLAVLSGFDVLHDSARPYIASSLKRFWPSMTSCSYTIFHTATFYVFHYHVSQFEAKFIIYSLIPYSHFNNTALIANICLRDSTPENKRRMKRNADIVCRYVIIPIPSLTNPQTFKCNNCCYSPGNL